MASITEKPSTFANIKESIEQALQRIKESFKDSLDLGKALLENKDFKGTVSKYGAVLSLLIFIIVVIYYAATDPAALTTKTAVYVFLLATPIIICAAILMNVWSNKSAMMSFALLIVALLVLFAGIYGFMNVKGTSLVVVQYFMFLTVGLIIIVGLAIIANVSLNYLNQMEGWAGFIAKMVFFIPCMFSDFLQYLLAQFHMTPNIVFVLFVLEALLIAGYFYLPQFFKKSFVSNGKVLASKPIFLDETQDLASANALAIPPLQSKSIMPNETDMYRRNYALSMWIMVNAQQPTNHSYAKPTTIFSYANTPDYTGKRSVKPMIQYMNGPDTDHRDKYIIYFANYPDDTPYSANQSNQRFEISLPAQKWNQFVFNYNRNVVDLFINGKLARTFHLEGNMPTYDASDKIVTGSENGLYGAICSVIYHNTPLTKAQIANTYTIMSAYNPPVLLLN